MKTAHTPGPWKIEETRANSAFVDVVGEDGWLVAEIEPNNPDAEANAHLIAAAPELLQSLRSLVAHLDGFDLNFCFQENNETNNLIAEARAAIDKATGGQP